jgi:hypothetical protein
MRHTAPANRAHGVRPAPAGRTSGMFHRRRLVPTAWGAGGRDVRGRVETRTASPVGAGPSPVLVIDPVPPFISRLTDDELDPRHPQGRGGLAARAPSRRSAARWSRFRWIGVGHDESRRCAARRRHTAHGEACQLFARRRSAGRHRRCTVTIRAGERPSRGRLLGVGDDEGRSSGRPPDRLTPVQQRQPLWVAGELSPRAARCCTSVAPRPRRTSRPRRRSTSSSTCPGFLSMSSVWHRSCWQPPHQVAGAPRPTPSHDQNFVEGPGGGQNDSPSRRAGPSRASPRAGVPGRGALSRSAEHAGPYATRQRRAAARQYEASRDPHRGGEGRQSAPGGALASPRTSPRDGRHGATDPRMLQTPTNGRAHRPPARRTLASVYRRQGPAGAARNAAGRPRGTRQ